MISTQYPTDDVFEDAVHATAYIARVDVRYGELTLPHRVREHLADGDVVVHLVRGDNDESVLTAQLTTGSKLVGINWPDDITAGTRVTVMCPRGSTSHDIGVLLPDLNVDWPDADLPDPEPEPEVEPAAEPVCTCTPEWCYVGVDVPHGASECRLCARLCEADGCPAREEADEAELLAEPEPVTDEQLAAITGALTALADAAPTVESTLPGPADYTVPTDLQVVERDEPTETIPAVEQTTITPATGELEWPTAAALASLEVLDLDRDYRPRWRRALAWVQVNMSPARAAYTAATGGAFFGSLITWLVTR